MSEIKIPEGWKLVPIEPTLEMQNAGWSWLDANGYLIEDIEVAPIYRATIAASPSPPLPTGSEEKEG